MLSLILHNSVVRLSNGNLPRLIFFGIYTTVLFKERERQWKKNIFKIFFCTLLNVKWIVLVWRKMNLKCKIRICHLSASISSAKPVLINGLQMAFLLLAVYEHFTFFEPYFLLLLNVFRLLYFGLVLYLTVGGVIISHLCCT